MVNDDLPDFCCSFKFSTKKHFVCTLTIKPADKNMLKLKLRAKLTNLQDIFVNGLALKKVYSVFISHFLSYKPFQPVI